MNACNTSSYLHLICHTDINQLNAHEMYPKSRLEFFGILNLFSVYYLELQKDIFKQKRVLLSLNLKQQEKPKVDLTKKRIKFSKNR